MSDQKEKYQQINKMALMALMGMSNVPDFVCEVKDNSVILTWADKQKPEEIIDFITHARGMIVNLSTLLANEVTQKLTEMETKRIIEP